MNKRPNIVIMMTDQQRADLSRLEGFPLDTTPFLDKLSQQDPLPHPRRRYKFKSHEQNFWTSAAERPEVTG